MLQKSLNTQRTELSSLTRDCDLPIFTANGTITNLTQYELSQEESDLLKAEETKSQIKAHLSYLANSYFHSYNSSPRILRQHRVLRNLMKNEDIAVIPKPVTTKNTQILL